MVLDHGIHDHMWSNPVKSFESQKETCVKKLGSSFGRYKAENEYMACLEARDVSCFFCFCVQTCPKVIFTKQLQIIDPSLIYRFW